MSSTLADGTLELLAANPRGTFGADFPPVLTGGLLGTLLEPRWRGAGGLLGRVGFA